MHYEPLPLACERYNTPKEMRVVSNTSIDTLVRETQKIGSLMLPIPLQMILIEQRKTTPR